MKRTAVSSASASKCARSSTRTSLPGSLAIQSIKNSSRSGNGSLAGRESSSQAANCSTSSSRSAMLVGCSGTGNARSSPDSFRPRRWQRRRPRSRVNASRTTLMSSRSPESLEHGCFVLRTADYTRTSEIPPSSTTHGAASTRIAVICTCSHTTARARWTHPRPSLAEGGAVGSNASAYPGTRARKMYSPSGGGSPSPNASRSGLPAAHQASERLALTNSSKHSSGRCGDLGGHSRRPSGPGGSRRLVLWRSLASPYDDSEAGA